MDKNLLNDLAGKLADAVPGSVAEGVGGLRNELRDNFHTVLQSALGKMDLVTREEFEVQRKVLERSREKLERLQHELEALQQKLTADSQQDTAAGSQSDTAEGFDSSNN